MSALSHHVSTPPPRHDLGDPDRLALIARLDLHMHLDDTDLGAVIATLTDACAVPIAMVNIVTPGVQTYPAEAGIGAPCTDVPDELSFCAEVVRTGRRLVVADSTTHPVYARNPFVLAGICAYAGEPLVYEGHVIGAVSICDTVQRLFTEPELRVLRAQARLASAVIRLRALAAWDALTGLATRPLLLDRADRALAEARGTTDRIALVVVDVVDMGGHNEELGSAGGDSLLRIVADRITAACGPRDSVARIGGDEFAVLFDAVASVEDARARASAVELAAAGSVMVGQSAVIVRLRCGLTTTPCDSGNALLAAAERAATTGPGCDPVVEARKAAQGFEADELRRAISAAQLVLHYHPVIDLVTSRMIGVEALVRWQHPRRGLLLPQDFIPLAEDSGSIVQLGEWVLRTGAAQAAVWLTQGHPLDVAINLSPLQMAEPGFAARVAAILAEAQAPAERIILEVTESALLDQPHAEQTLAALRASGIRLALDDFGTGYSSFSYLRRFPVDTIKIDRSFVAGLGRHPDDDAIVASVVSLARNTGKSVVAEGVETLDQLNALRGLGVGCAQGFLWTRPLPADQVLTWAQEHSRGLPLQPPAPAALPPARDVTPRPGSAEETIASMHLQGASLNTIAAALNNAGHRTAKGVRWHVRSVARVVAPSRPRTHA